jgi:hypothetical protein
MDGYVTTCIVIGPDSETRFDTISTLNGTGSDSHVVDQTIPKIAPPRIAPIEINKRREPKERCFGNHATATLTGHMNINTTLKANSVESNHRGKVSPIIGATKEKIATPSPRIVLPACHDIVHPSYN